MPQPNKFQSPPHPQYHQSQGSITGLPFESTHMRNPGFFFSNASVRRISSRRARPVATSIADIFVRSLVMAGYCHEHTPRSRCLSTVSTKAPRGITRNWEDRRGGRSSRRVPAKGPSGSLSQIGGLGACHPRTQRMLNSSVAQRAELHGTENQRIQRTPADQRSPTPGVDYQSSNRWELLTKHSGVSLIEESERVESSGTRDGVEDEHGMPVENDSRKSHAKRLYKHTSEIYKALFEGSLAWKEAADAVAAFTPYPPQFGTTESSVEFNSVQKLEESLLDKRKKNHYIFELYREVPSPGVKYLSKRSRGALLRRFARPPDRRWIDARRYLALVEDMLAARLPISRSLWTSAIYLAGRSQTKVKKQDLVRAIGIWNQMEHLARVESDDVVFTILFDIAVKAGQYTVADRLLEEMDRRNLRFGRSGKVAVIFYYGLKGDSDGVRRTFESFVQNGELVDTAVMNCVLASLLRCGERNLAEELYARLLQTQSASNIAQANLSSEFATYRKNTKRLGRVLQISASLKNRFPDHHATLQKALEIGPDTRTFHILLTYHTRITGNLNAVKNILRDMDKFYSVPPRGMIYLLLFEGFAEHGAHKKSRWSADRLWRTWETYVEALYECNMRLKYRAFTLPPDYIWENPLEDDGDGSFDPASDETSQQPSPPSDSKDEEIHTAIGSAADDFVDPVMADIFDRQKRQQTSGQDDSLEALENRLENGVFLGRRMITVILRAFGALCDHDDITDIYLHMMEIWQPRKRRMLDVAAVKEELEYQLTRAERRRR